jgi:hypothetical protein
LSRAASSTRFRKGESGNPNGRPRKARDESASAFDIVMDRRLDIVQDGVSRELSIDEALQWRTYQDAIGGSRLARREVLRMIAKREKALAPKTRLAGPMVVLTESSDPDNADEALLILGIAAVNSGWEGTGRRLLLEPWAVQAAVSRSRSPSLTQRDVEDVRRSTRDAKTIRGLEASQ